MTEPKINHFLMPNVMNGYQDMLSLQKSACSQVNDCESCPYKGVDGDCDLMWCYLDDYAVQHRTGGGLMMEYRIRQWQIKNMGVKRQKPQEIKKEGVFIQCVHCKYQETVILFDGKLSDEFKQKFAQVNGDIFHKCSDGLLRPCQKIGGKK